MDDAENHTLIAVRSSLSSARERVLRKFDQTLNLSEIPATHEL